MTHISFERSAELARGERESPEERAHLAACPACRRELEIEQELRLSLTELAPPTPPLEFVAAATGRFAEEQRQASARRALWLSIAAALTALSAATLAAAVLFTAAQPLALAALTMAKSAAVGIHLCLTLVTRFPSALFALTLLCVAAVVTSAWVVARLAHVPAMAK